MNHKESGQHIDHIDMSKVSEQDVSDHVMHAKVSYTKEYVKFAAIVVLIFVGALMHYTTFDLSGNGFLDSFMGVFFLVFASFKFIGLTDFVVGFREYDVVAKKFPAYGYVYPFIQLFFAIAYLVGGSKFIDVLVILVSVVSAYGVYKSIRSKRQFHCVCLGNVIKLPLSRISLVEDVAMAVMAAVMLFTR